MGICALFRKAKPAPAKAEPEPSPIAGAAGSSGWARAGMRFDVHRMSREDLRELAHQLVAGGAISTPDFRLLALEPVTYAAHWPGWDTFETSADAEARRDWMEEISARIRKGYPDRAYIGYLESLWTFLQRVEAARPPELSRMPPREPTRPAQARPAAAQLRQSPGRLISPLPRPAST